MKMCKKLKNPTRQTLPVKSVGENSETKASARYPQEYPTQEALAQAFGKPQNWVSRHLAMLQLEKDEIIPRGIIETEKLSEGQAREILAAPPEKREEVAKAIAEHIEAEGKPPSIADIRKVSRPDEGQRVRCACCGNTTSKPVDVDEEQYCQVCSAVVKRARSASFILKD
jgi:hypothetical protein